MRMYEEKSLINPVLDIDDTSRRVKVAMNKVGIKDSDNDIIEKSAFNKTIKERGPSGSQLIWHLTDHTASLKSAVGKPKEIGMEGDYLYFVTDIPDTTLGNDVLAFYKAGAINQHSIGFSTIKREVMNDDDFVNRFTVIKEVKLYEGSAVLWGANDQTPTLSVGKSLTKEQAQEGLDAMLKEYETLTGLFRKGTLSDDTFGLLEIKIAQLNQKIKSLFTQTTQPVVETVEPDQKQDEYLNVLKQFINN